jgi:chaperonin GroES
VRIYDLTTKLTLNSSLIDAPNLVDRFDTEDLTCIGNAVWNGYQRDEASRIPWMRRMNAAMDLAMQIQKDKNFPWPGCSNIIFPLITIAALQFSARSYSNIIQGTNVVRYRVPGEDPQGILEERATRIGKHMSWQVLEQDKSWEEQHDQLLINLGIVGCNFVKTYFSAGKAHNVSDFVPARDLVIDYWAKSVDAAMRKTQIIPLYRNEIYERVKKEIFADVLDEAWFSQPPALTAAQDNSRHDKRQGINPPQPDEDTPFTTLEQHRYLDLDKDGYAEPYIVTIEYASKKVLRITSRIEREEDIDRTVGGAVRAIKPVEYFTKYSFVPAPDGGIYDVGFGILLGPINEGVNTGINQIFDSGTMANSNGGFLGRGAKIRGGVYTFAPWEWKRVDSTGDDLRKSLVQLPTREPSTVMFNLIGLLIQYCDRLAGTVDTMVGENPGQNTKTGVANQTLEQGMQVYSSIFKRVWRSMKEEFSKLHQLNRIYMPVRERFGSEGGFALREDYTSNPELVAPVADPRIVSEQMRVAQAEALANRAATIPGYDTVRVERNQLTAMRIDAVDKFYPGPDKIPAPPNPSVEIERMKLQSKQLDLEHDKMKFLLDLQEQRRINTAKIAELRAKVIKLMSEVRTEGIQQQMNAFELAVTAMESHNRMLDERMKVLKEVRSDEGQRSSERGGVPGMAEPVDDSGVSGVPEEVAA